mgnify:CR=1 FL=1
MKIKHILLFLIAWVSSMSLAYAQQTVVASGSVMDEKGELLIGVSISVKEVPSMGAITDIDGRFKIGGIKAGHTLVISYVGYDPQEIKMNKSNERMRVVLKESSNVMDEVVITASGKVQKKINVTGAITGVEVATLKTPATSISNMLGGRVPGIISVTRSGEPGKDFSEFWVRGISTFGAGQGALVLIDGVEGNLNTLDPEDIESFSILKDASSTAVYGVRGANGVVLVSTKKGKAGKLNLQVKANAGISYSPRMPKYVRAAEYAALANEAAVTRGRIPVYSDVDVDLFRNHMDPDFHPDVDWRDVILRDYTWNQQYFLSASGGGEVARYYISAGFTTKDAIFKQDKGVNKYNTNVNYNKFNFRANVDVNVTSTTTLSLNEETVIVTQNYPGYGNDSKVLWQAQSNLTPVTVPLMYTTGQAPGYGTDKSNISPYVLLNMTGYRKFYSNDNKITMQLNQDLKMITPGLSIAGLVNINSIGARTQVREKMPAIYYAHGYKRDGTLDLEKISDAVERYVYVELVNPLGNLVERVKIRPDSLGCFYGHIPLGEDLPEGNYSLRAYTWFMQNIGEEYFPHKLIYISDPVSEAISPEISYSAENNDVHAEIHFLSKPDNRSVTPTQAILFPDGDRDKEGKVLSLEGENIHYTFKKKEIPASRTFLLQTVYDGKISNRYFRIPELSKTFDVAFFPEGGHAAQSTTIKMAFKAIDADGLSTEVEGQVFDEEGQVCADFKSQHLGMGSFRMYYVPGKKYHAVCSDGTGVSKRFDLPEPSPDAISLNTLWSRDYLRVSLSKSPDTPLGTSLTLVAHLRGIVLYAQPWDDKQNYVDFEKDFFPAGIVHFLLVDEGRNILSERLVFSLQKSALAQTEVRLDRENYLAREKVDMDIQIKDINGNPMSGNFALAVVDRTDVKPDTVSNIVSTLLLTSDLKGHIESPLSYLQDSRSSSYALDLLMMTQGWRKYNIPEVLKGNVTSALPYNLELGDEVSGKVEGLFSALKEGNISLLALKDSLIGTELTKPDRNGRFVFDKLEYPSGTHYIVQALSKKGSSKVFIELDPYKSFPAPRIGCIPRIEKPHIEENYMAKMDQKYTIENGMRVYNLAEVIVTGRRERVVKTESPFYSVGVSKVLTEEDVKKGHFISTYDLLRRLPGITITNNEVRYRFAPVMVLLDNVPEENFDFDLLDVDDIKDVFYSPATSVGPLYGAAAGNGAIVVTTKNGFVQKNKMNSNMQTITTLGYQQTVEFYSPAYDTEAKKESVKPDLRSTIYWNPSVQVDESGTVQVSFYTADSAADYGVVIEGVCTSGNLIYSGEKVISRHSDSY